MTGLSAKAVADMQVESELGRGGKDVSHFNIYRDTKPGLRADAIELHRPIHHRQLSPTGRE